MPNACVLISDITGSTQLYEHETNEKALEQISVILDRMRELIEQAGGHCVKSQGDDALSYFSSPDAAFQAAWAMINETWPAGMSVHAGLYAGEIVLQDNDIYGNAVNTSARLAAMAKPGEILLGDNCYDGLSPDNKNRFLLIGEVQLRGKDAPTMVYACSVVTLSAQTVVVSSHRTRRRTRTESAEIIYGDKKWLIEEGQKLTIGRSTECDVVLDHAWVSRRHAVLSVSDWQLELTDHSSTGSILQSDSGQQTSVHRITTQLSGDGLVFVGAPAGPNMNSAIQFKTFNMELKQH